MTSLQTQRGIRFGAWETYTDSLRQWAKYNGIDHRKFSWEELRVMRVRAKARRARNGRFCCDDYPFCDCKGSDDL